MKPVRGGGSASELTMTSWSALATTTRSRRPSGVLSSSSAVRRSTDVRSADPDDPGQRAGVAGGVADQPDPVADDDRLAAQLAGPHRGDLRAVDLDRVAAPVDRDHEAVDGVVVSGPGPGART